MICDFLGLKIEEEPLHKIEMVKPFESTANILLLLFLTTIDYYYRVQKVKKEQWRQILF